MTVVKPLMSAGMKRLFSLSGQARYEAAVQKQVQETAFEVEQAVRRLDHPLRQLEDREAPEQVVVGIYSRLFPDAASAVTQGRRRMLAAAIAGSLIPNLEAEAKSRLTRAIQVLEPSDVLHLYCVVHRNEVIPEELMNRWRASGRGEVYSNEALLNAGCLSIGAATWDAAPHFDVTQLGKALLDYLAEWINDEFGAPLPSAAT